MGLTPWGETGTPHSHLISSSGPGRSATSDHNQPTLSTSSPSSNIKCTWVLKMIGCIDVMALLVCTTSDMREWAKYLNEYVRFSYVDLDKSWWIPILGCDNLWLINVSGVAAKTGQSRIQQELPGTRFGRLVTILAEHIEDEIAKRVVAFASFFWYPLWHMMRDWHSRPGWREKGVFGFNEDEEDEEEEAGGWSWWWEQMMIWHHGPIWPEKDEFASFSFTLPLAQHSIAQLGFLWKHGKAFLTHHFFGQTGQSLAEKNALWIIDKEISERGGVPLLQSQFHKVFVDS